MNPSLSRRLLQVCPSVSRRPLPCRVVARRRIALSRQEFSSWSSACAADNQHNPDLFDQDAPKDVSSKDGLSKDSPQARNLPDDDLKFYGSARRRAMRSSRVRMESDPLSFALPSDFLRRRIILHNEPVLGRLAIRPVTQGTQAELSKGGTPEASGRDGSDEPSADGPEQSDAEFKYEVVEDVWNELDLSIRAGLQRQISTGPQIRQTQPNIVVNAICESGQCLVKNSITQIARKLEANVVVLDAVDVGEIAENSHHFNSDIMSLIDLGFDVYKEKDISQTQSSVFSEDEQDGELGDLDSESSDIIPQMSSKPFTAAIHLNLSSGLKPILRQVKRPEGNMSGGLLLAGLGDDIKSFQERKESSLWDAMIQKILRGPSSKAGHDLYHGSQGSESLLSTPMIILIQDLPEILRSAIGEKFISKLVDAVYEKRRIGDSICLVGSTSTSIEEHKTRPLDRPFPLEDDSSWQVITFPALSRAKNLRTALYNDKKDWYRSVNERLLLTALRPKKSKEVSSIVDTPIFPPVDDAEKETNALMTRLMVSQRYLSKGQIDRMATLIAGHSSTQSIEPFSATEARTALGQLLKSDVARASWINEERKNDWGKLGELHSSADYDLDIFTGDSDQPRERPPFKPQDERRRLISQRAKRHEKKFLGGVIEPDSIKTTFDAVHVPVETIDAVKTLTTLSLIRPDAFSYGVLASDKIPGLLLYGPPGTGKTLLAKAAAKESGATVLEVSGAEINDMFVGESEKNIKALFSLAKKLTPCVIFIDEADSIFSSRTQSRQRTSHREMINQFLREWDGMSNDAGGAFIMVATNRPFDLDDAVLRRLPRRVLVDLPAEHDRLEILRIHLKDEQLAADVNLASVASRTAFYSGSDLKNLSVAAALNCVREENDLAKRHIGMDEYAHPVRRTLYARHFDKALEEITASISDDMESLKAIKKFDEQFGDRRGRKKKGAKYGFRSPSEADQVLDTVKVRA